jgi:hypothetical protein
MQVWSVSSTRPDIIERIDVGGGSWGLSRNET